MEVEENMTNRLMKKAVMSEMSVRKGHVVLSGFRVMLCADVTVVS